MGFFDPGSGLIADAFRGSPDMPEWQTINPREEQRKAISGNISALPRATELAAGVNTFNREQIQKMMQASIPGYDAMKSGISGNIESWLKGEIPSDVEGAISRSAAARALGGGFAGSQAHGNLVARDLGLTSLDLTQKGLNAAEQWMKTVASIEQPGMFNVASMFLTPEQVIATDISERDKKFEYDWGKSLQDWQTSFGYSMANEIERDSAQFNEMAGSVLGKFAGSAMGGV